MNAKRKDTAKEPSEVYETSQNVDANKEELHPILVKLLEKPFCVINPQNKN